MLRIFTRSRFAFAHGLVKLTEIKLNIWTLGPGHGGSAGSYCLRGPTPHPRLWLGTRKMRLIYGPGPHLPGPGSDSASASVCIFFSFLRVRARNIDSPSPYTIATGANANALHSADETRI